MIRENLKIIEKLMYNKTVWNLSIFFVIVFMIWKFLHNNNFSRYR